MLLVSVIIVNYKTSAVLSDCIDSLYAFEDSKSFEVIVVDNASNDGTQEKLSALCRKYDKLKCIFLEERTSFSRANNTGAASAKGEYLLILNPDIIFTKPVLDTLIKVLKNDAGTGAVSPLLIGEDGNFQANYFQRYPTILQFIFFHSFMSSVFSWSHYLRNRYLECVSRESVLKGGYLYVEQLPFAFFLTTSEIFCREGKMDEMYDIYFEDVDFSYRLNRNYRLVLSCDVSVRHIGGVTFNTDDNWWVYGRFVTSQLYFFRKNYGNFRYKALRFLSVLNSEIIIIKEKLKSIFKIQNDYRLKKHLYFLEELKNQNGKFGISSNTEL